VRGELPLMFDPAPGWREKHPGKLADWETRPVAVPVVALRESLQAYTGTRVKGELLFDFKSKFLTAIEFMFPQTSEGKKRMRLPENTDYMGVEANDRGLAECIVLPPLPICRAHAEGLFGNLLAEAVSDEDADRRYGTGDEEDMSGLF